MVALVAEGFVAPPGASARPVVTPPIGPTAMFAAASYAPGQLARLHVVADAGRVTVRIVAAVPGRAPRTPIGRDPALTATRTVAWRPGPGTVTVRIGDWPSGVYFARVRAGPRTVLAPVIVRAARLGARPVAVIVPTFTWQAYNRRDGDTWYACSCVHTVDLSRPYLDGGIPYNFAQYDRGFLTWLSRSGEPAVVLSDQDLNGISSGAALRRLFRLIVFEGHGEYVTSHMYDVVARYRDLGGHLAFLSANDFFRDVTVTGDAMTLVGRWRDLGRPEAALIGSQYLGWYRKRYRNRSYIVAGERRVPWLFAGTGLENGDRVPGSFGIEIDGLVRQSPRGTIVVADIPDIFPGKTAQMTYYATSSGAEVFNAGTINFGGAAGLRDVSIMLRNLWSHLAGPAAGRGGGVTRPPPAATARDGATARTTLGR